MIDTEACVMRVALFPDDDTPLDLPPCRQRPVGVVLQRCPAGHPREPVPVCATHLQVAVAEQVFCLDCRDAGLADQPLVLVAVIQCWLTQDAIPPSQ